MSVGVLRPYRRKQDRWERHKLPFSYEAVPRWIVRHDEAPNKY